ncbi:hypothetical protein NPIL_51661 [Nephila pilipes]|uniref:Uncharacterized protein n=1 Tax=Nephila pilipes TaxID=299642 RepID=A0A8X6Q178_NEPPI|nr:hypothetical protein NPIL_51661 [Nephila pilipes]
MDESIDVTGLAALLEFVRLIFDKKNIEEALLMSAHLRVNATEDIFNCINDYFIRHEIGCEEFIDFCRDGTKAIVGKKEGIVSRILQVAIE